ncbi:hypothetical protein [Bartonella sp. A05]|uniref:hypothetical protein n=1 Tax=Bartonella sp. A05 TaxID=2967261 RepID=UPI0022A914F4|nr:hypothetical protein [Bartonella sp. A05]MCZ2203992.1 hypothetical protein [Bartonella sp. A05]
MKYAVVKNGVVTNIIVASENYVYPSSKGKAILSNEAQIGWIYKDGVFTPSETIESVSSETKDSAD